MKPVVSKKAVHTGAYKSSDKFTSSEDIVSHGGEDGDNSLLETCDYETKQDTQLGTCGDGGGDDVNKHNNGDKFQVNVEDIIDRFKEATRLRLKDETTEFYEWTFRRFASTSDIEKLSRRQLAGTKGKKLLLMFLESIPPASRRYASAALRLVWEEGLRLPYPISNKRDLGRLPRPMRRETPSDAIIKEWIEAIRHERDPYLRLVVLLIFQHGWRPSHACRIKHRNVRYERNSYPYAIIADGSQEGFKTSAPVIARLTPDVAEAIQELAELNRDAHPEDPLLPFRRLTGSILSNKMQSTEAYRSQWVRFKNKHCLPDLRMVDVRHWVASVCRKAGLSKQASAALMGHDSAAGNSMRDWYDTPQITDLLEEQERLLPDGPSGYICPKVEIAEGLPEEIISLVSRYWEGKVATMEFVNAIEILRLRHLEKPVNMPEP